MPRIFIKLKATLVGHEKNIDRIAFSPDGEVVATVSKDGNVRLWSTATGNLKSILSGSDKDKWEEKRWYTIDYERYKAHQNFPDSFNGNLQKALENGEQKLSLSPDRRMILTSKVENPDNVLDRKYLLNLWDLETGGLRLTFEGFPSWKPDVYWSPDGKTVIWVGYGRTKTRLLDASSGRIKAVLSYRGCTSDNLIGDDGCQPFIFNSDSSIFLKEQLPIRLWSANNGEFLEELKSARLPVVFSPVDKHLLVTAGKDKKTALLWEVVMN